MVEFHYGLQDQEEIVLNTLQEMVELVVALKYCLVHLHHPLLL